MYTQGLDQSGKGESGSRGEETAAQLDAFQAEASRYVRLSYGMTPPPTP